MAITHKDINLLTQKATIAGTEKIPVSDTEYVTTTQIASLGGGGGGGGSITVDSSVSRISTNPLENKAVIHNFVYTYLISPTTVTDDNYMSVGGSLYENTSFKVYEYDVTGNTLYAFNARQGNTVSNIRVLIWKDSNGDVVRTDYNSGESGHGTLSYQSHLVFSPEDAVKLYMNVQVANIDYYFLQHCDLGIKKVALSGSYNDLSDKPTIPVTVDNPQRDGTAVITSGGVMNYCLLAIAMTPTETIDGAYMQRAGTEFSTANFSYRKYNVTPGEVCAVSSVIGGSGYSAGVQRIAIWLDANDNVLSYSDETNERDTIAYYRDVPLEVPANATTMVVNYRNGYSMSGVAKKLSKPNPLVLLKVAQTLTSAEQAQARTNIGAAAVSDIPTVPTNVSDFTNDAGYITGYTETDPTVPSWAKAPTKPTYTASEVGALPSSTSIPDSLSDLSDDSTHRVVTDTEKSTWNGKQNAITISSSEPTASQGSNGDIWIVV